MQYKNVYGILKQVNLLIFHPKCSKKIKVNFIYVSINNINIQIGIISNYMLNM